MIYLSQIRNILPQVREVKYKNFTSYSGNVAEDRKRRIREFQNSPQYQEMQKYREEYRKWQENLVSQMQEAFKRGDMARVSELRMKLIRKEGAPERPKFEREENIKILA